MIIAVSAYWGMLEQAGAEACLRCGISRRSRGGDSWLGPEWPTLYPLE